MLHDSDGSSAQAGTHAIRRLDLQQRRMKLAAQGLRQLAWIVFGQNLPKPLVVCDCEGHMCVLGGKRCDREALVMARQEGRQPGVGSVEAIDAGQAHGLDQAVLQSAIGAFNATLGLRRFVPMAAERYQRLQDDAREADALGYRYLA